MTVQKAAVSRTQWIDWLVNNYVKTDLDGLSTANPMRGADSYMGSVRASSKTPWYVALSSVLFGRQWILDSDLAFSIDGAKQSRSISRIKLHITEPLTLERKYDACLSPVDQALM